MSDQQKIINDIREFLPSFSITWESYYKSVLGILELSPCQSNVLQQYQFSYLSLAYDLKKPVSDFYQYAPLWSALVEFLEKNHYVYCYPKDILTYKRPTFDKALCNQLFEFEYDQYFITQDFKIFYQYKRLSYTEDQRHFLEFRSLKDTFTAYQLIEQNYLLLLCGKPSRIQKIHTLPMMLTNSLPEWRQLALHLIN